MGLFAGFCFIRDPPRWDIFLAPLLNPKNSSWQGFPTEPTKTASKNHQPRTAPTILLTVKKLVDWGYGSMRPLFWVSIPPPRRRGRRRPRSDLLGWTDGMWRSVFVWGGTFAVMSGRNMGSWDILGGSKDGREGGWVCLFHKTSGISCFFVACERWRMRWISSMKMQLGQHGDMRQWTSTTSFLPCSIWTIAHSFGTSLSPKSFNLQAHHLNRM